MNCVGFFAIWSDTAFFMRGAPAHPGSTCTHAMGEQLSTLKSTPTDGASLCWSFGVGRIDNDLDGAPTRIRVRAFSFPESECFELRIRLQTELIVDRMRDVSCRASGLIQRREI